MINFVCAGSIFSTILYVIIAIVVLLLMVLIHELGHYVVGRALGFKITEFSIGFGKAIFSKVNKRGEKISLRIFPLGGFCAFAGEDEVEEKPEENKEEVKLSEDAEVNKVIEKIEKEENKNELLFNQQKPWKRILVYLAGVTFNFISAIIFSFILLVSVGYDIQQVSTIDDKYTQANLQTGDIIYQINDKDLGYQTDNSLPQILDEIQVDSDFVLTVKRDGEIIKVTCKKYHATYDSDVKLKNAEEKYIYCDSLGNEITEANAVDGMKLYIKSDEKIVEVASYGINTQNYRYSFIEALVHCVPFTLDLSFMVLKTFWLLITFQLPLNQLGGPITTISLIATQAQANIASLLVLIPLIAANLAVFNILPFPALDGSHVIFTTIEWIRGKPINRTVESYIHFAGLIILFAFVIIVDIIHFVS